MNLRQLIPRKRTRWLIGGSAAVISYLYFTDPNDGALTAAFIGQLATPVIAVWFAFLARKAIFDYLDIEEVYRKAKESTVGAGLIFLGTCIVFFGLLGLFGASARAQDVNTYIPAQATQHVYVLKAEQKKEWPSHSSPFILPG